MGKWLLLACICSLLLSACQPDTPPVKGSEGIGDPYYPKLGNGGYDVQKYTIAMKIDPGSGEVQATTTVEAKATEDLSSFDLDFAGLTVDYEDERQVLLGMRHIILRVGVDSKIKPGFRPRRADFGGGLQIMIRHGVIAIV